MNNSLKVSCITDIIDIDSLSSFLYESSQKDDIGLRIWSPKQASYSKKTGWLNTDWVNSCFFHTLIRSYDAGAKRCYNYFAEVSEKILNGDELVIASPCPTGLYTFAFPIRLGSSGKILAIIHGGLLRNKSYSLSSSEEWNLLKDELKEEHAVIDEIVTEFNNVHTVDEVSWNAICKKWKNFAQLLSIILSYHDNIIHSGALNLSWLTRLTRIIDISSIVSEIMEIWQNSPDRIDSLSLTVQEKITDGVFSQFQFNWNLQNKPIKIEETTISAFTLPAHNANVCDMKEISIISNDVCRAAITGEASLPEDIRCFIQKIASKLLTYLMQESYGEFENLHLRSHRLQILFDELSKKAITNVKSLTEQLFDQLQANDIIKFNYASFTEVIYLPKRSGSPFVSCLKPCALWPKNSWSDSAQNIIKNFSLFEIQTYNKCGSTVLSFLQARSVIDRDTSKSTTYVATHSDVKSSLVVPISYGPMVIGVFCLDSKNINEFDNAKRQLLESLSNMVAPLVYQNVLLGTLDFLLEKVRSQLNEHQTIAIHEDLLQSLSNLLQSDIASYWNIDTDGFLRRFHSVGDWQGLPERIPLDDTQLGDLYNDKISEILVENLAESPMELSYHADLMKKGIISYLAIKVKLGDQQWLMSFYRQQHSRMKNRYFSEVEFNIANKLVLPLTFYQSLSDISKEREQKLSALVDIRERMAITLAHNFKGPLSGLAARLSDINKQAKDYLPQPVFKNSFSAKYHGARKALMHLHDSAEMILNFSPSNNTFNLTVEKINFYYEILAPKINDVRKGLNIHGQIHKRRVDFSGVKDIPVFYGNRNGINDAVWALLENSVKYSGQNDTIEISLKVGYLGAEIQLEVKNPSVFRISGEDRKKIFDYGFRTKNASNAWPMSTGVGLSRCKEVISQHNGKISLVTVKKNINFEVTIPTKKLRSRKRAKSIIEGIKV